MTAAETSTADPPRGRAERLLELHRPEHPLLLANCWDAASARAVAEAGFPAVATSSAAVAGALGYPDGQAGPVEQLFAAAARIAAAVDVPVTVDAEAGYGLSATEFVRRLAETGAVGCNLEDTDHRTGELRETNAQADWLAAVRQAADAEGIRLVLNARVDTVLLARNRSRPEHEVREQTCARAAAYFGSGVDCVYPIFAREHETVRQVVAAVRGRPVNLLYLPGGIALAEAAGLGIARVSLGAGLWHSAQAWLRGVLTDLAAGTAPY